MSNKHLLLIRHGESEAQLRSGKARRDPSLLDCHLTKKGERQARGVRSDLSDRGLTAHFDLVCTSPLTRAIATCVLGFGHLHEDVPIVCHPDLAEVGSVPENQPRSVSEVVRDLSRRFRHNPVAISAVKSIDFSQLPPNWPESNAQRREPTGGVSFLDWIQSRSEERIAVVCHHNVIQQRLLCRGAVDRVPNCVPIPCTLPRSDDNEGSVRLQLAASRGIGAPAIEAEIAPIRIGFARTPEQTKASFTVVVKPAAQELILAASQKFRWKSGQSKPKKSPVGKKAKKKQEGKGDTPSFLIRRVDDGKQCIVAASTSNEEVDWLENGDVVYIGPLLN